MIAPSTIGHYQITTKLGEGGMGAVYRATDTRLGREVAIKVLPPDMAQDPDRLARFQREARAVAAINHPHIVTVFSVEEADGIHFLTMELIEGESLDRAIPEGGMPLGRIVELGIAIAEALAAAHDKGIVHRDLKPANVMLTHDGRVKVLDFGLARDLRGGALNSLTQTSAGITQAGTVMGTPAYMSPEQVAGEVLDHRTDFFSLGVVLYEMATGRRPFSGATSALVFDAILNRAPAPPSGLNPNLLPAFDNIVSKLLEKPCWLRYQNAHDIVADLRQVQRDTTSASTVTAITAKTRQARKIDSLAVLPFANVTGDAELDYTGDAIAEALIDALSRLPKLRVVPRGKAFRYRDRADDPQSVGRDLGVRAVLGGRIARRADALSIRAELVDVARDSQLWGAQFNRNTQDVLDVQEEIARQVAEKIGASVSGANKAAKAVRVPAPVSKEAYQLFVRGMHYANRWTPDGLHRGIELYRQAIDVDPAYGAPYASMAIAHGILTVVGRADTAQAFRQAKAYARRAIELDEGLSEAHAALGMTQMYADFNLADALREAKRSVELNPRSPIARYAYSQALSSCGRLEEGIEHAREGCDIDPLMAPINYCYGLLLNYARRWDEADAQLQRTLDINPHFLVAEALRSMVLARQRRFAEAMTLARDFIQRETDHPWQLLVAYVAALAGDLDLTNKILEKQQDAAPGVRAYFTATIHGVLGELDKGFAELERARDLRFAVLSSAVVNPALDPFRADPRWKPFLESMNFGVELTLA